MTSRPDPLLDLVSAALRARLSSDLGWGTVAGYALADLERLLPEVRAVVDALPDRASDEPDDADLDDLLLAAYAVEAADPDTERTA